jgi:hypothetical protein
MPGSAHGTGACVDVVGRSGTKPLHSAAHHAPTAAHPCRCDGAPAVAQADRRSGQHGCTADTVYWTTGDLHAIDAASTAGDEPRPLARAAGKISPLVVSARWLAWVAYEQEGDGTHLASWSLDALQTATGRVVHIASATTSREREELPMPSVDGDTLVWDELTGSGAKVLWVVDLTTLRTQRLALPAAVFPVRPVVEGNTVAFLDNATDPARGTQFWATRGGRPMLVHLDGTDLQALDGPANAQIVRLRGDEVAWVRPVADPSVPNTIAYVVQLLRLGAAARTIGMGGVPMLLGNHAMVWYDDAQRSMVARLQATGQLGLAPLDEPGSPGGMALCDSRLYFAGTGLTIKYLQLP